MKTYNERTASILEKAKVQRKRRNSIRAGICSTLCVAIVILSLGLFTPYDTTPPSVEQYAASDYYSIITKINKLTYQEPNYQNPFEEYVLAGMKDFMSNGFGGTSSATDEGIKGTESDLNYAPAPGLSDSEANITKPNTNQDYVETTDNQVAGVIEGDRFKRSDEYIYYLGNNILTVYSIDGADSTKVGAYEIPDSDGFKLSAYADEWEIFLSSDCKTITLVSSAYHSDSQEKYVVLVGMDVSDPSQIKEISRTYLTGSYLSARMVDGNILLMANYTAKWHDIDFNDITTFIPQYGTLDDMKCVDAASIVAPEELTSTKYTVICKIDAATLEAKATGAFLSYSDEVYVSSDNVYASRSYTQRSFYDGKATNYTSYQQMTEISAMNYSGDSLKPLGTIQVAGYLENQYSMDEYEGILRVVTTTDTWRSYHYSADSMVNSTQVSVEPAESGTNASLYCIDLDTWQIVASVEGFAPEGETVRSVRFDKNNAYVCTALTIVELTDPVYFFDLSDLSNITYKDTGTITGFSSSLVNFGDYLLGIGYGENWDTLKIEIYQETATKVESVCSYEVENCSFSTEYKAYLVDRENMRVGLGYHEYSSKDMPDCYTLLQFDGYELIELVKEPVTGNNDYKRAVIIDGYLYMFGENFMVKEI